MRTLLAAALLLWSSNAVAQNTDADLFVRFSIAESDHVHAGDSVTYTVSAMNRGPMLAQNLVVTIDVPGELVHVSPLSVDACTEQRPIRCTMRFLPTDSNGGIAVTIKAPAADGTFNATATVAADTADPNPADNSATVALTVSTLPDLAVSISTQSDRVSPGEGQPVVLFVSNSGSSPAHDVRMTFVPSGGAVVGGVSVDPRGPLACNVAQDGTLVCTAQTLAAHAFTTVNVRLDAPRRDDGGTLGMQAEVSSTDADANAANNHASSTTVLVRQFAVTTVEDDGAGSLRQAIRDADAACSTIPCRIVFRIDSPTTPIIHPLSPLPPVSGIVTIEASAPGVEIRGDRQPKGDGITIDEACEVRIVGLTINSFPASGIAIARDASCKDAVVRLLFPPVGITGNVIGLNLRGVVGSAADTVDITGNLIGGNRRSAIFLGAGRVANIRDNVIGLTRDGAPAPNGASGIYVNTFSANISQNVIAHNTDFGVAVSAFSPAIALHQNRIFDSGHTAIDIGLDLETPNGDDVHRKALNHPVITSAHYDAAADKTIVRGRFDSDRVNGANVLLEFYASHALNAEGHAQAERFLGETVIAGGHNDFELAASGDLTGQWVAATATYQDFLSALLDATSELSAPVQVSP